MNKRLKGTLAVLLVLVSVISVMIVMPTSASAYSTAEPITAYLDEISTTDAGYDDGFSDLAVTGADIDDAIVTTGVTTDEIAESGAGSSSVGAIKTLKRTTDSATQLGLTWNKVTGAQGYRVYWRNADIKNSQYALLSTVKSNSLTIRNLKDGSTFFIKVAAYKVSDGKIVEGANKIIRAATNTTGVKNFRIYKATTTYTQFAWSKNSRCDGYIIYRKSQNKWSQLKVLKPGVITYSDTSIKPGVAYYYNICTYRFDSGGIIKSSVSTIKTFGGMNQPADLGCKSQLRRIILKWGKSNYAHGYDVYCSTNGKQFKLLTSTTDTSYITGRLPNGKQYYFRIFPYRLVGASKTKLYGKHLARAVKVSRSAYGKDVPSTYIEVSIKNQHMWFFINDQLYVSTPVVTGNANSMDTPKGYWAINNKASPCSLVGPGYVSYVQYWMSFIGSGYGIHDASWRSSFGGTIYQGNGSHGCINTPYDNVKKMYSKAKVGTPVIVY